MVRVLVKDYPVPIKMVKRQYFSTLVAFTGSHSADLSRITHSFLERNGPLDHLQSYCEKHPYYLADKPTKIHSKFVYPRCLGMNVGWTRVSDSWESGQGSLCALAQPPVFGIQAFPGLLRRPVRLHIVALIKYGGISLFQGVEGPDNPEGGCGMPAPQEAISRSNYFKQPSSCLLPSIFMEGGWEVVGLHLSWTMEKTNYLDLFQSGFRYEFHLQTLLVTFLCASWSFKSKLPELRIGDIILWWLFSFFHSWFQLVLVGRKDLSLGLSCVECHTTHCSLLFCLHLPETEVVMSEVICQSDLGFDTYSQASQVKLSMFYPNGWKTAKVWMGKNQFWLNLTKIKWLWTQSQDYPSLLQGGIALSHLGVVCNSEVSLGLTVFSWWTGGSCHQEDLCIVPFSTPFLDQSAFQSVTPLTPHSLTIAIIIHGTI